MLLFAERALAEIPKLLTLQDREPSSPTYGCFDRNYWQYRMVDYPMGMAQELVWPLALVWDTELPNNPYHRSAAVRDWIEAGIRFAMKSAHPDGSCDDFFPYERAVGAAAFTLLAHLESAKLIGLGDPAVWAFLERRARWLGRYEESGRLSNHEALIALGLARMSDEIGARDLEEQSDRRLRRLLSWQHEEGWFWEYEGCDPGYQTLTLSMLARLHARRPTPALEQSIRRCLRATAPFLHPDGTFGGEYGSRNTINFFPHGFELIGRWLPEALAINDGFLEGLAAGRGPCYSDDHIIGHHLWNYLLAFRDRVVEGRPPPLPRPDGRIHFPGAGLLVDRRDGVELIVATNKGGVFKLFEGGRLVCSDTQLVFTQRDGRIAVANLVDAYATAISDDRITVEGSCGYAKQRLMGVADNLLLRSVMVTAGRFFPNLVRRGLQSILITDKREAPIRFRRTFQRAPGGGWIVEDEARAPSWRGVEACRLSGHQTSIYVIQSRVYQENQLKTPSIDLTEKIRALEDGEPLRLTRTMGAPTAPRAP